MDFDASTVALSVEYTYPLALEHSWLFGGVIGARYAVDVSTLDEHPLRLEAFAGVGGPLYDEVIPVRFAVGPAVRFERLEVLAHAVYHARQLRTGGQAEPTDWMHSGAIALGVRALVP